MKTARNEEMTVLYFPQKEIPVSVFSPRDGRVHIFEELINKINEVYLISLPHVLRKTYERLESTCVQTFDLCPRVAENCITIR